VLVVWQLLALSRDLSLLSAHPSWSIAIGCLRYALYAIFLSAPAVVFLVHGPPSASDDRIVIRVAAILASFLLILLGLLVPSGPMLFKVPLTIETAALMTTLIGAALAVCAVCTLGMNFSFGPEARQLVVRGPYRIVRHPVYLAEILMSCGVLLSNLRLTMVAGECAVVALQIVRIHAEDRLLGNTFPMFHEFESVTRFRLVPGVW
jgi:protein-S-isoprenylcysteine O-methyltransferase Ste14